MKVSFSPLLDSLSIDLPSVQTPPLRRIFLGFGTLFATVLLCLSVWIYTQGDLSSLTRMFPVSAPSGAVLEASPTTGITTGATTGGASYETALQLRQEGDLLGAVRQLEAVKLATPLSIPVLYELGRAQFQLGFVPQAVAQYRAVLALDPDHAPSAYELGSILVTLGQLDEGIRLLQHSVALEPTALSFYDLGIALGRAGDLPAQLDALTQAVALQPGYADAYLNLGLTYARMQDLTAAKTALQQARDLYQAEIEKLKHAHLGRNSLDAQIIDQMLLSLDAGCGVECWAVK